MKMPLSNEWHVYNKTKWVIDIISPALLRLPLPLRPALFHHIRNAFARGSAHMAALAPGTTSGLTATRRSSPAACLSADSLQCANGPVETFAFHPEVRQYILDIHASPFELLQTPR
jgi:hypothetical protein